MTADTIGATTIATAADRLTLASTSGTPCAPVRELIGADDVRAAYAVQREVAGRRSADGDRPIGRKVGLTSVPVRQQLGVDQPDFGVLFDGMAYTGGSTIPYDAVLQPRVEAEVAFVLAEDLVDGDLDVGSTVKGDDHRSRIGSGALRRSRSSVSQLPGATSWTPPLSSERYS